MKNKPIIIVAGEPNSIFFEIFIKAINSKKFKTPLILIASENLLKLQMRQLNLNKKIKLINFNEFSKYELNNKEINLINVNYKTKKAFEKISNSSNQYLENSFKIAFQLIKKGISNKLINGPISKSSFLNKKYLGMTEYISSKFSVKKNAMLIFNKNLSVCPLTTHIPIKLVSKKIKKRLIYEKVSLINKFYKKNIGIIPNIGVAGLNPHCESNLQINEDETILRPAIKDLKNLKYKIYGPYPADTLFLKQNRKKFDVIIGMYHDQVLTPLKTIYEYDAINITLGLPFIRISPDHGPNEKMIGKNMSDPLSLIRALEFLDKN